MSQPLCLLLCNPLSPPSFLILMPSFSTIRSAAVGGFLARFSWKVGIMLRLLEDVGGSLLGDKMSPGLLDGLDRTVSNLPLLENFSSSLTLELLVGSWRVLDVSSPVLLTGLKVGVEEGSTRVPISISISISSASSLGSCFAPAP